MSLDPVYQVLMWLVLTLGILAAAELFLYVLIYRHDRRLFWPMVALMAAGIGAGAEFAGWYVPAEGETPYLATSLCGLIIGLLLGAFSRYILKGRHKIPIMMLAPAFIAVCLLVI